jgi:hypothetical protein
LITETDVIPAWAGIQSKTKCLDTGCASWYIISTAQLTGMALHLNKTYWRKKDGGKDSGIK